ncbi:uncharacterized protein N7487_003252 [Penicillium crustosum]|uniref:uncharacterized protein n=1 Tax=Penicillium crustosum TaxID=36656 RepID=UPI00238E3AD2|nr:uncharacterized protein N7487_003252 [Penicillium crustosum]KAJ5419702.1 hypothetical protein N7487_003252 [Penicillium crustosum]
MEKRERYLDVRVYCSDDDLEVTEEDIPGFYKPYLIPFHRCLCLLQYLELSHGSFAALERYLDAHVECREDELEVT